jgi:threonine/homoserine/homoserine lactone efflux protein
VTVVEPFLFLLAVVTILGTPGPTNTLLATAGAAAGVRRSLLLVPAELGGYLTSILIVSGLLHYSAWRTSSITTITTITTALRVVIGLYLLFLAVHLWRIKLDSLKVQRPITFTNVFITTCLNPKAIVLAVAVIPLRYPERLVYLAAFSGILIPISLCWIWCGSALARGRFLSLNLLMIFRLSACAVACFALVIVSGAILF